MIENSKHELCSFQSRFSLVAYDALEGPSSTSDPNLLSGVTYL